MIQLIKNSLQKAVLEIYPDFSGEIELDEPKDKLHGDFSSNIAMKIAKDLGKNPREVANEISDKWSVASDKWSVYFEQVEIAGPGFINFKLSKKGLSEFLGNILKTKDDLIGTKLLEKQKFFVEFAHPNTHKAFHIGHLRNICLGESLVRIFESHGAEVFRANYQGDIGPHVAKCIWAIQREGIPENLNDAQKRAEFLGKVYAIGGKAYENDEKAKAEIIEINKDIYIGENQNLIKLYKMTRQWSLDYFEIIYAKLGTKKFDRLFFESEVFQNGKKIVEENLGKIFTKSEGAIVFEGEKYGLHTRVFVTKNNTATYEGKELGLAFKEYEACPDMDKKVHIVANEQSGYFQVLFKVIEMLLPKLIGKQVHVDYGIVKLTTGKMSSRTGDVITAEWLIDELKNEIANVIKKSEEFNLDEIENIKEKVAIGAIKFVMLYSASKNDISFDLKKAVRLDGDSGPYIQYAYARIRAILRRKEDKSPQPPLSRGSKSPLDKGDLGDLPFNEKDFGLIRKLLYFEKAVKNSTLNYSPHFICHYLLDLTSEFSSWYAVNRVLDEKEDLKNARLQLLEAVSKVFKNGLYLLGIETLERM
ncbi:MAG: arginyl-tRNA synthetase, arginyl-tRNA synthetase [Candidatus Peregrinibacteria bacterium GW2011_GWF2_33_10]|nr:MAG: arginyl-tRNA synthetase, arginyl-tRNA synthetase [Candidatus Peregrinibacteria bacterium GW2011_GWF2_33_10]OGJ45761.1 MAG: arginine--tRNA ligase [Candidatus Peregrinibacteria bacterium RIFOXYA2_FULL_33_21]OGJ46821.1 MAG: arginine--tRNA ligase [Candidatus Peregrinibacteria bacterium RIFOXYA12_FULL_33_12]OGJ51291.1 MAG: arginine--tRNA ligase [Candidatus Peregrinibacteria bacterium RIFOXYB2_FULL_33_20]